MVFLFVPRPGLLTGMPWFRDYVSSLIKSLNLFHYSQSLHALNLFNPLYQLYPLTILNSPSIEIFFGTRI